ncbi:hypothetical protein D9611_004424 [Ephemerocybe angulata]|uniref:HAT C-terminal dimerisation domain-containing protein n=1 Tax=Ephemerocybe angulata TaxID=980116 RepID=A0A8H5BL68_9AGAR|nr:hypothetical protein D9611_004424 [Tulosesus angulatus]
MLSELDRYLSKGTEKGVEDPLAWWHDHCGEYPRLWHMAHDYLTIPATSVAVECAWTKQKLVKNSDLFKATRLPEVKEDDETLVEYDYPIV